MSSHRWNLMSNKVKEVGAVHVQGLGEHGTWYLDSGVRMGDFGRERVEDLKGRLGVTVADAAVGFDEMVTTAMASSQAAQKERMCRTEGSKMAQMSDFGTTS